MISKNKIKFLRSLKLKKHRDKYQKTILEGVRLITESLNFNADIQNIWATEEIINSNKRLINKIKSKKINFEIINDKDFKLISDTKHSQGILAEVSIKKYFDKELQNNINENIVILDNISDPGNIGTILRTCAWYNIRTIVLTNNTSDPFNLKCIRSGMGSHFYFSNLIRIDGQKLLSYLDNNKYKILCADLDGKNLDTVHIKENWAIILGSEAHGISNNFKHIDKVAIKKTGKIESLNVSVAAGIILEKLTNQK